jgi:ABC-2 type transport system ATP-binding protein
MTSPAAIHVENLTKVYTQKNGVKQALDAVNLSIPAGSFFGLLGPNGAGKSTFINILAGLTLKTSGKVTICGTDIDENARGTRYAIGVVPQELVLDPFFTVREALENHAGYYGIPKKERRTDEIINALGLTDKADVKPRSLSGGMKRRLLIAKALVHSPAVLVLDEPTAGVDVELRQQLWDYVEKLNRMGTTIVLTTHYLEEAERLCDHIAIIDHGRIIANDKTSALLHLLDQKQLTVRFSEIISSIPEPLATFDTQITEDGSLLINYKSGDVSFDHILTAITHAGLTITDLSTEEADLEDIFRHLTGRVQGIAQTT